MDRPVFLANWAGGLLAAPFAAEAQREKVSRVVVFDVDSPTPEVWPYEHVEVVE